MQAFPEFRSMSPAFWAAVKFISEGLGYSARGQNLACTYSMDAIQDLMARNGILVEGDLLAAAKAYLDRRTDLLNRCVRASLMTVQEAQAAYENLYPLWRSGGFRCKLPLNKQKGDKRQVAFFTAIINILTEDTLRRSPAARGPLDFDDDPRGMVYVFDGENRLVGASSRRFDGAFPSIRNPKMVWEIKEYYYSSTFGSRVADGVYETQLDGYEFREIAPYAARPVTHVFFLDGYSTWWEDGKSYLCRIIDILNAGLVDEVIVGREVFQRWPELLTAAILA